MAKHQLLISSKLDKAFPFRSEEGQYKKTLLLIVNWTGTWGPRDRPDLCLVVAPGDELEIVLAAEEVAQGGSLHFVKRGDPGVPLLASLPTGERQGNRERVDLETGSVLLQVDPALSREGELLYGLRISGLRQVPYPIVGQGQAGSLTATRP